MSEKGFLEELPPSSAFNPGTLDSKHKLEDFVCNVHVAHGVLQACPLILHLWENSGTSLFLFMQKE